MAEEETQEPASEKATFCQKWRTYFPTAVYFLLVNILLEMIAAYGIHSIFMIYLKEHLLLPEWIAKLIFHASPLLNTFFPLIGAVLADMYVGKFWLLVPTDLLWMTSFAVLALSSYTPFGLTITEQLYVALGCLAALKFVGLKGPARVAFPGDQYVDSPTHVRDYFYSVFYFCLNLGSLIGMIVIPRIRTDIHCLENEENCFPASYGISVGVSVIATIFLYLGYPFYKLLPPAKKTNWDLMKCFCHGAWLSTKKGFRHGRAHWADLADDKYDETTINDVKNLCRTSIIFTAFPVFWALFHQQPSLWTMMSSRMDGRSIFGQILPDQMDSWNPLLVMIFIVIFDYGVYPLSAKINFLKRHTYQGVYSCSSFGAANAQRFKVKPLERIGYGFILGILSYFIGAMLYIVMENSFPAYPDLEVTDVAFQNGIPCQVQINLPTESFTLEKYESAQYAELKPGLKGTLTVVKANCPLGAVPDLSFELQTKGGFAYTVLFVTDGKSVTFQMAKQSRIRYFQKNAPKVRFVYIGPGKQGMEVYIGSETIKRCFPLPDKLLECDGDLCPAYFYQGNSMNYETEICYSKITQPENCTCHEHIDNYAFIRGGIYEVMIVEPTANESSIMSVFTTSEPDSVPVLLQVPMYIFITAGEIMCSITAYSFAYSEAPGSTKSWLLGVYYVNNNLSNLVIIVTDGLIKVVYDIFIPMDKMRPTVRPQGSVIFLVYAVLMILDTVYFVFLARRYTYANPYYQDLAK